MICRKNLVRRQNVWYPNFVEKLITEVASLRDDAGDPKVDRYSERQGRRAYDKLGDNLSFLARQLTS